MKRQFLSRKYRFFKAVVSYRESKFQQRHQEPFFRFLLIYYSFKRKLCKTCKINKYLHSYGPNEQSSNVLIRARKQVECKLSSGWQPFAGVGEATR